MSIWGRAMYPEVARVLDTPTKRKARVPRPKASGTHPPPGRGGGETGSGGAKPADDAPSDGESPSNDDLELPVGSEHPHREGPVEGTDPPELPGSPSEPVPSAVAVAAAS